MQPWSTPILLFRPLPFHYSGLECACESDPRRTGRFRREEAEAQLHLELAVALYRQGQLPVAQAASLAGLNLAAFEELLHQRGVTMPYTLEDLEHDVAYASGRR